MNATLDCIPCLLRQAVRSARLVSRDPAVQERMLRRVLERISRMPLDVPAPRVGREVHATIREESGQPDPFREIKHQYTRFALDLLPRLEAMVQNAHDPFETAIRLAIAGNIIDFGSELELTQDLVETTLADVLQRPLAINDLEALRAAVAGAADILYLADNAGELVFDRLLLGQLAEKDVTLVVKGGPIINDATLDDAREAGIDSLVRVITNGSDVPGTIPEMCSPDFRRRFQAASLVIAKGQGNFETLSRERRRIFYLLKVKCQVVASLLGCRLGDLVVMDNRRANRPDYDGMTHPHTTASR